MTIFWLGVFKDFVSHQFFLHKMWFTRFFTGTAYFKWLRSFCVIPHFLMLQACHKQPRCLTLPSSVSYHLTRSKGWCTRSRRADHDSAPTEWSATHMFMGGGTVGKRAAAGCSLWGFEWKIVILWGADFIIFQRVRQIGGGYASFFLDFWALRGRRGGQSGGGR